MPDDFYLILGLVALIVTSFMTLIYILFSDRGPGRGSSATAQSDLTNMMILFQTMRDILTQQKDLAREFNISIDKKVNEVRRLIESTGDVRKELERTRRELAALGTRTRKDISALERRLQGVDLPADEETEAIDDDAVLPMDDDDVEELRPLEEIAPPLEIIPEPEDEQDLIVFESWRRTECVDEEEPDGIEIEDDYDSENGANGYADPLGEDEVAETRAAYRDLLNLQPTGGRMRGPSTSELLDNGRETNGGHYLTPIQKRVYEYSDAGMRVPEIARELGVGKGEVRLILSLRHDRGQ